MQTTISTIDFANQLRRSRGRSGRVFVASAKVTRPELNELEDKAQADGKALSEWARETLLREARRSKTDPVLTEIIANRMLLINVLRPLIAGQKMSGERFDELLTAIKAEKRNAAREVLDQYAVELPQEATDGE